MAEIIYPRMAVVGCGLIGSSVARAARAAGVAGTIAIADANPDALERIAALQLGDEVYADAAAAAADADLIVVATPPASIGRAVEAMAGALKPGATLTDVGSVKHTVSEAMAAAAPEGVHVIPGHPIAGTEQSGPDAGFAELFRNRWTILCPRASDDPAYPAAVERLTRFWTAIGANVETMEDKHHDMVLAVTSHLPHLIAYNIVGAAAHLEAVSEGEVMKYSAGGFRDFTRIAASDPVMWRDVFLLNREAVLEMLARFNEDLQALARAIRWGEGDKLQAQFTASRAIRRGVIEAGQESPEPNFGRDRTRGD